MPGRYRVGGREKKRGVRTGARAQAALPRQEPRTGGTRGQSVRGGDFPIHDLSIAVFTVPTDRPESYGTLAWQATTLVVVHAQAGGERGLGYTYADAGAGRSRRAWHF